MSVLTDTGNSSEEILFLNTEFYRLSDWWAARILDFRARRAKRLRLKIFVLA
jgi:hypothetical protein